jgi:hypothetical protein
MRKFQKAALVVAALGSIGFVGAGTASAHGGTDVDIKQSSSCQSHDLNVDILGEVGVLNGVLGNALGGEGNPGAQATGLGSSQGCNNAIGG